MFCDRIHAPTCRLTQGSFNCFSSTPYFFSVGSQLLLICIRPMSYEPFLLRFMAPGLRFDSVLAIAYNKCTLIPYQAATSSQQATAGALARMARTAIASCRSNRVLRRRSEERRVG